MTNQLEKWCVMRSVNGRDEIMGHFTSFDKAADAMALLYNIFNPVQVGDATFSVVDLEQYRNPADDIDIDYIESLNIPPSLYKDDDARFWVTTNEA